MAYLWFTLFILAASYIVVIHRGGAVDQAKVTAALRALFTRKPAP